MDYNYGGDGGGGGGGGGFVEGGDTYGGGGGGGGYGGFGGGAESSPSGGGGGKKWGNKDTTIKTLIPVTLRKLSEAQPDAQGEGWVLDKRQLNTVRVVAALRDDVAEVDNTRVLLHLFDGSGAVQLTYFPDPDDTVWAHTRGSIAHGDYVDVVMSVKPGQGGSMTLNVLNVRRVADSNAVTHHLLQCLFTQLEATHGPLQPAAGADGGAHGGGAAGGYGAAAGGGYGAAGGYGGGGGYGAPAAAAASAADAGAAGGIADPRARAVHEAFRVECESAGDDGVSVDAVVARLRGQGLGHEDVGRAIEFLTMEGLIYSTIDDQHFKVT